MTEIFEVKYPKVETSIVDRIKLIEPNNPVASPATCVVCGGIMTNGKTLIDFGLVIQYYGRVQLCNVCFDNAAKAFGYVSPKQQKEFEEKADNVVKLASELLIENGRLREYERIINIIRQFDSGNIASAKPPTMDSDSEVDDGDQTPEDRLREDIFSAQKSVNDRARQSTAITESNAKSGYSGVRDTTKFDISTLANLGDI